MEQRRRAIAWLLAAIAAWYGWNAFSRSAAEVATLHVSQVRNEDHFARIWVVEERPYVWIRAESPDRRWLAPLEEKGRLTLTRHGEREAYAAQVWEDPEVRSHVDALFREKYGLADLVRALLWRRDSIPIRLTRL